MIEAMKQLGDFIKKGDEAATKLSKYFHEAAKLSKTKKVLCVRLVKGERGYCFKDVTVEDYSKNKPILYKGGSPSGVDVLPSSLITNINKTFKKKIVKWFERRGEREFREIGEAFKEEGKILEAINKKYDEIKKNERNNVLLTIKIIEGEDEKHLGEIPAFRAALIDKKPFYYRESIGESKGRGICRLCGKEEEVYGFVLPTIGFSFATADKPGFEYGFDRTSRWKQIPICEKCSVSLVLAKSFIDEHLSFPKKEKSFIGCQYYVIPKFVFGEIFDEFKKLVEIYGDKDYNEGLLTEEDWLMNALKDKHDTLRLIFIFYKKKVGGKYIDIVRYVEDVLPSWMKKIHQAQEKVKKLEIFNEPSIKEILGKNWMGNFVKGLVSQRKTGENNWYAVFLRDFFPSSRIVGTFDVYYFNLLSSILSGEPVSEGFLISNFIRRIRSEVRQRDIYNLRVLTLKSFMLRLFFNELNILRSSTRNSIMDEERRSLPQNRKLVESKLEEFFHHHNITNLAKKASFLVGALVDYLLKVQREERKVGFGEEPFWDKIHSLMLDERKVKKLFGQAIGKLRQYRRGYPALEELAGRYLMDSGEGWNLSSDEVSYYFTLGLTLSKNLILKHEQASVIEESGSHG